MNDRNGYQGGRVARFGSNPSIDPIQLGGSQSKQVLGDDETDHQSKSCDREIVTKKKEGKGICTEKKTNVKKEKKNKNVRCFNPMKDFEITPISFRPIGAFFLLHALALTLTHTHMALLHPSIGQRRAHTHAHEERERDARMRV